ncbi:MAG: GntR family transcriptional regulator [Gammaproteobacteria bacterium]|nr:GntR family transcriptional regulator [Gammaproteobacteria bacterium]MBI5614961.1 GntR family transcriptional regulator [Gammaproteobacteria bacterium]
MMTKPETQRTAGRAKARGKASAVLSSSDQVAAYIRNGVRRGRYVPGQRLVEADLTLELGVSRGPVREALKRLAAEGMVELHRNRGAAIRQLTRRKVNDILAIQEHLTGLAARLAAEHIAEGDHGARFQAAVDALFAARDRGNTAQVFETRLRFYEELVAIGGNQELARFVPIPETNIIRAQFEHHLPARVRARNYQDYETVARYILKGKAKAAEAAMQRHLRMVRQAYERLGDEVYARD